MSITINCYDSTPATNNPPVMAENNKANNQYPTAKINEQEKHQNQAPVNTNDILHSAMDVLSQANKPVNDVVKGISDTGKDLLKGNIVDAAKDIGNGIVNTGKDVVNGIASVGKDIGNFFSSIF
jgi:hypothetical protein